MPAPPEEMGEYGREVWRDLGKTLIRMGILGTLDLLAFGGLCTLYDRSRRLQEIIEVQGAVIPDKKGSFKRNPACGLLDQVDKSLLVLLNKFGCTPAGRQSLDIGTEATDEIDEFMDRRPD